MQLVRAPLEQYLGGIAKAEGGESHFEMGCDDRVNRWVLGVVVVVWRFMVVEKVDVTQKS